MLLRTQKAPVSNFSPTKAIVIEKFMNFLKISEQIPGKYLNLARNAPSFSIKSPFVLPQNIKDSAHFNTARETSRTQQRPVALSEQNKVPLYERIRERKSAFRLLRIRVKNALRHQDIWHFHSSSDEL